MVKNLKLEVVTLEVKAVAIEQKITQQTQLSGKVHAIAWLSRMKYAPDGTTVIGTTSADAPKGCYLTLKEKGVDRFNAIPLPMFDPDFRLGTPYELPEPIMIDWTNSHFRFANAAHVTAGEKLVLHVYYVP